MEENLFENIKKVDILLPLQILEEYANSFNETFKGKLVFEIKHKMEDTHDPWTGLEVVFSSKEQEEKNMVVRAYIIAPELNNYRLLVLKLVYKISQVYPCNIECILDNQKKDCKDSNQVKSVLKGVFTSQSFQKPVQMLLAQV